MQSITNIKSERIANSALGITLGKRSYILHGKSDMRTAPLSQWNHLPMQLNKHLAMQEKYTQR